MAALVIGHLAVLMSAQMTDARCCCRVAESAF